MKIGNWKLKIFIKNFTPRFLISWYHFLWAFLSALVYGFPSRKIRVIGITGTNGKTTTANLTAAILEEAGYKVAVASSIKFKIGDKEQENKLKMTMPGHGVLQKFLRDAVRAGCEYAIIEATSEGVLQHRHRFINWQIMVFTNLSPEHIERHGSFENYKKAKGEYFNICKGTHIVNVDDENADYFLRFPARQKVLFSLVKEAKKYNYKKNNKNTSIHISPPLHSGGPITPRVVLGQEVQKTNEFQKDLLFIVDGLQFKVSLIGRFNVYNALAAICVGLLQGVSLENCQKALAKITGVPGRMEEVIKKPFRVVVDYAFTPNALEQVYQTLNSKLKTQNSKLQLKTQNQKLICVLGACGGGRDKWKRPVLGEIAGKYCSDVIVTNEDPYDENPLQIIKEVLKGVLKFKAQNSKPKAVFEIIDRREAIRKALELARPGDTVIITGKGAENSMAVKAGKKIPWDDRQVVREEFAKFNK